MASERTLSIKITGDAKGLSKAFGGVQKDASRLERGLGGVRKGLGVLAKSAASAGVAVGVAGAAFAKVGLSEAIEQEKVMARTVNVIKTTGGAAHVTAQHVADLAGALQKATGSADDEIQSGANLLLTFKEIKNGVGETNQVFDRTVAAANDMSVALGMSMTSASMQLGKALNDPAAGLGKLARVGVNFTRQQQEQIKAMQASGDVLGAQKIMLAEVESQVGGAASSEGALTEASQAMRRMFEDVAESVMSRALPALTSFADMIREDVIPVVGEIAEKAAPYVTVVVNAFVSMVQRVSGLIRQYWPQISELTEQVFTRVAGVVSTAVGIVSSVVAQTVDTIRRLWPQIQPVLESVGGVFRQLAELISVILKRVQQAWNRWGDDLLAAVRRVFSAVLPVVKPLLDAIAKALKFFTDVLKGDWSAAFGDLKDIAVDLLKAAWAAVKGLAGLAKDAAVALAKALLNGLKNGLVRLGSSLREWVMSGVNRLRELPGAIIERGRQLGQAIVDGVVSAIRAGASAIRRAVLDAIPGLPGGVSAADSLAAIRRATGGASGWMIPGTYQGRDTMLAAVAPGEAILTPRQQSLVEAGMPIRQAIASTGGRVGGRSFARGGVVTRALQNALQFAQAQVGEPYSNYARTGPNSWDCSGYAGVVASKVPGFAGGVGGTTVTYAASSTPAKGDEPLVFGFRSFGSDQWVTNNWRHMGVRILGHWFDAGGKHGGVGSGDSNWVKLMVPAGLQGLKAAYEAERRGDGTDSSPQGTAAPGALRRRIEGMGLPKLLRTASGGGAAAGRALRPLVNTLRGDTPDYSGGMAGSGLSGVEQRSVARTGRAVKAAGRAAGKDPQQIADDARVAERTAEGNFLKRHLMAANATIKRIQATIRKLNGNWSKLVRKKAKTAAQKAARKRAEREVRVKLRELRGELNEALEVRAEIQERLLEIGEEVAQEQYEASLAAADSGTGGDGGDGGDGAPTELDRLNLRAVQAQFTEDTSDDLAVARDLERYFEGEAAAAASRGDIVAQTQALQSLLSVRSQIEALSKNTDALNANTDAMREITGSVTFGYRGQDYVLRSLAAPSSDRLENLLVGA